MSNTIGNSENLDAGRAEALQGLLSSLGYTDDAPSPGAALSKEQLQKLSGKINEILGDGADRGPTLGGQPGQLLNEEGLPIIDISEQVDDDTRTDTAPPPAIEQDLIPFSLLPPDEMERRRRERDRILDLLEEEERLQQLQEERDAEEQQKEAIRKRKESVKAELEQLKSARELQKKMGRALVRSAEGTGENEPDARLNPQITVAKKSVSFADAPAVATDERDQQTSLHQPDWGDVTPGRLREQGRIPLVSTTETEKYPMKVRVVERLPPTNPTSPFSNEADSDDEPTSSAEQLSRIENDSSDEDRSSSSNNGSDEPLEEEFDYDAAQHYREIALEYHKRRNAIAAETTKVMTAHTLDDYEQHEALQFDEKLPLSRFRVDRMAAAYDKSHGHSSTLIGQTVIPASRQKSLRSSVRVGKLEDDQLVGGDSGESGSEDEIVREVIQMLRTGGIQNAGPDFKPSSMSTIAPSRDSDVVKSPSVGTSTAAHEAKPSRFKLARGGRVTDTANIPGNNSGDNAQPQPTISSVVERKATRSFPVNKPPSRSPVKAPERAPPMTIDSPSFPMTTSTPPVISSSSPGRPVAPASPSHQTQLERPPLVKPSASQDSTSPRPSLSAERSISKFMAERRK